MVVYLLRKHPRLFGRGFLEAYVVVSVHADIKTPTEIARKRNEGHSRYLWTVQRMKINEGSIGGAQ